MDTLRQLAETGAGLMALTALALLAVLAVARGPNGLWVLIALFVLVQHLLRREYQIATLARLAGSDETTRLGNRRALKAGLRRELKRARRRATAVSFVLVDLDGFKEVNDRYGHTTGDRLLLAAGTAIREALRRNDLAFRYGGDEFAVLLPGVSPGEAAAVAERIRHHISQAAIDAGVADHRVTASCGVVGWTPEKSYPDANAALEAADAYLYRAKLAGRDCVSLRMG